MVKLYAPPEKNVQCESRRCLFLKEAGEEGGGGEWGEIPLSTCHLLMQAADIKYILWF